jgi:hypothetical protein
VRIALHSRSHLFPLSQRVLLRVEYDGANYHGFQRQTFDHSGDIDCVIVPMQVSFQAVLSRVAASVDGHQFAAVHISCLLGFYGLYLLCDYPTALEVALSRLTGESSVGVLASGRTDAGVHALDLPVSFVSSQALFVILENSMLKNVCCSCRP